MQARCVRPNKWQLRTLTLLHGHLTLLNASCRSFIGAPAFPLYGFSNDAWDGYGGAVVYSRDPIFPKKYEKEIAEAVAKVGVKWSDFQLTDNSCRAAESRLEEIENDLIFVETKVAGNLQVVTRNIGDEIQLLEKAALKEAEIIEKEIEKDVIQAEKEVESGFRKLFKWR
mmetsp:Transcript_37875/g.83381  ORF Transcript_37875/g.83381 Transcript_37875/m.83381 type:complete len:170 (-) Transcript_37875:733-1242(-)